MKKIILFVALSLMSVHALFAQKGELVKDINMTRSDNGLRVQELVASDAMFYMIADNGLSAQGLWKSDATASGTVLVKEFPNAEFVGNLTTSGGNAYFVVVMAASASLFDFRTYLYKSDGTNAGTVLLGDLGSEYSVKTEKPYANSDGKLYFVDQDGLVVTDETGNEKVLLIENLAATLVSEAAEMDGTTFFITLNSNSYSRFFKSDGTKAGTVELKSNPAGPSGTYSSLVTMGSNVYFSASNAQGMGLYKISNATEITLVKAFSSGVQNLTRAGNSLYFTASDGTSGNELWKTDGTASGTALVKNISAGTSSSDPSMLTVADGQLYFVANDKINGRELWKSGGTAATTELVSDIRPGIADSEIKELTAVGSKVAFLANDGSGGKLWQSNGNVYGTKVLFEQGASSLLNFNGNLYFNANADRGPELFKSTMITGGTSVVTSIARPESIPLGFTEVNGISYFSANDGIHGRELWKTDGSTAGTVLVSDVFSGANSSFPEQITNVNGTAFFVTGNGSQVHSLWKSNGTAATTIKVKDFTKSDTLKGLIHANGILFFGVVNGSGSMQLWKSNGSTAGTQLIKTFAQTTSFLPVTMNGQVFFGAYDGINSIDLWKSNGTASGTALVKDLAVSAGRDGNEGMYTSITVAGNLIYYIITDFDGRFARNRLVKSDGTAAGTTVITKITASFSKLTTVNNLVFFIAFDSNDGLVGEAMWRTDGTEQGTFRVKRFDFYDYDRLSTIFTHNLIAANGNFYCVPKTQEQLWKSDGTVQGTQQVTNIGSLENGANIRYTAAFGNTLYFTATDGIHGLELWKTQGTAESTSLAYDLNPDGSTLFYEIAALNNQLLISADNGLYGAELFRYTEATTDNSVRINAGGTTFTASGNRTFSADQYFAGIDRVSTVASGDILNTADDDLYRSGRCSPSFSYNIPMPNGKVNVILHFAEIWYGVPGKGAGGTGKRQFNVTIEGSRKLTNFDIFATAGGAMRAIQKSIPVTITDGMLNIDFTSGAADLPRVSAIEVVFTSFTMKSVADAYVQNGTFNTTNFGTETNLDIKKNTAAVALNRSSYLRFQLPQAMVNSAKLRIYGHNHENGKEISVHAYGVDDNSWTENSIVASNAPAASTASLGYAVVSDIYKYYEIDVTAYVKTRQQSGEKLVSLLLNDPNNRNTRVIFNSKENSMYPPELVIQPVAVNSNPARLSQEEMTENALNDRESSIYPNPSKGQFAVSLSMQHAGPVSFELISQSGKSYAIRKDETAGPGKKIELDVSGLFLNTGLYLLKIQSDNTSEVIKMLVTE